MLLVLKNEVNSFEKEKRILQILTFTTPAFCTFFLKVISGEKLISSLTFLFSLRGILNIVLIAFLLWVFYAISNSKRISITITVLICFVLGFVNYALLQFRDSPLLAADLILIRTALEVSKSYSLKFNSWSVSVIVFTICWLCITWSVREKKTVIKKEYILKRFITTLIVGSLLFTLFFHTSFLRKHGIRVSSFKSKETYKINGYMLSFCVSTTILKVEKPYAYSASKVQKIADNYKSDSVTNNNKVSEKNPNIIFVMNEAFSDIRLNGDIPMNQEYMPYYYSLKDRAITGQAYTTAYAGQTAVSEFEILTGFTMRFMPYASVPYVTLMKDEVPNLTTTLRDSGYAGMFAFHPGVNYSYNRDNAYPLLGFNEYRSVENMNNPELIRAYVSDKCDYEYVENLYEDHEQSAEADKPFYIFNVTIQNHGGYGNGAGEVKAGIEIEEPSINIDSFLNYLNLMKISDEELKNLHEYFDNVDEPTIVVIVGDHQPGFPDDAYEKFYEYNNIDVENKEQMKEANKKHFVVPFAIWANYDIPERSDELISLNYLSSYVLDAIGANMTGYNKYLMDLHDKLPVISTSILIDKEGNQYTSDEKNPYGDILKEYHMVQYNGFMDKKNQIRDFFYLIKE